MNMIEILTRADDAIDKLVLDAREMTPMDGVSYYCAIHAHVETALQRLIAIARTPEQMQTGINQVQKLELALRLLVNNRDQDSSREQGPNRNPPHN